MHFLAVYDDRRDAITSKLNIKKMKKKKVYTLYVLGDHLWSLTSIWIFNDKAIENQTSVKKEINALAS